MIGSFHQWHDLPIVTPAAILTRIGRINFDYDPASFFRFGGQLSKELRPRGVVNAFRQTMVLDHSVDRQVFYRYDTESINLSMWTL